MNKALFALAGLLCLCSCARNEDSASGKELTRNGDNIILSETSSILNCIEADTVESRPFSSDFSASGEVRVAPSRMAEIRVPFTGVIVRSYIHLGQQVAKGRPLFAMTSSEYTDICRSYLDARQELDQARRALDRKERLCRSRVISQGELEESRTDWELKKQACEEAAAALDIFGIRPDEVKLGEPLIVRAPISGKIVSDNLTIGQYVKEDSDPLAVIADLSTVWVVANIKERDLANISKLEKADIRFVAVPDSAFTGRIFYISDMLDAESRAVEAIIECDNPDGALRPHMFATVSFHCSPRQAIVIPASAVLQDEDCTYVIKKTGDHSFRKVTVKVSENNGGLCAVSSGISEGDVILTKGAFYFLEF